MGVYIAAIRLRFRYRDGRWAESVSGRWARALAESDVLLRPGLAALQPLIISASAFCLLAFMFDAMAAVCGDSPLIFIPNICFLWCAAFFFLRLHAILRAAGRYYAVGPLKFYRLCRIPFRRVTEIPLADIRGICVKRSPLGRIFGYGTLIIEARNPRHCKLRWVPKPEQLVARLCPIGE
jgi:hypothetical protein